VLRATVEGTPDRQTGYLCNIKHIDRLLRDRLLPMFQQIAHSAPNVTPESAAIVIGKMLSPHAPPGTRWVAWELRITPFLSYTVQAGDLTVVHITQSFEFAAAHRLHCPELSDADNRENLRQVQQPQRARPQLPGRGHHRRPAQARLVLPIAQLERIVKERVIDRFDHKHLNEDCAEFRSLNPSVENITHVIWDLLDGQFAPARLARVRVWETPKTCC